MNTKKLTLCYLLYALSYHVVHASSRNNIPSRNSAAANISRDLTELSDNVSEVIEKSDDNPEKGELQGGITNISYDDIFTKEIEKEQTEASRQYDLFEDESTKELDFITYATKELKIFWHTGQCKRDYMINCPKEWKSEGENTCSASEKYNGQCNNVKDFKNLGVYEKEEYAWKCAAGWSCIDEIQLAENLPCPVEWVPIENNLCLAPQGYKGICPPIMDFSKLNLSEKAEFEQKCGIRWKRSEGSKGGRTLYNSGTKPSGAIRNGIIYHA